MMKNNQKILIGIGILGLLVIAGIVYVSQIGITPTDTKIVTILEENKERLLSIDGVVGAGIARDEYNAITGIAVYVEDPADYQEIPKRLGEFNVVVKKMDEATEFEKERMIIRKQVTSTTPSFAFFFPTQNDIPAMYMDALLEGKLEVDDGGCLRVNDYLIVWPYGFDLTGNPTVIDSTGKPIASVGYKIKVGGGEVSTQYDDEIEYLSGFSAQLPNDRCLGPYWIASPDVEVTIGLEKFQEQMAIERAIYHLSYPVTIVEVKKLECDGCFSVILQRDDNQKQFTITLENWKIAN